MKIHHLLLLAWVFFVAMWALGQVNSNKRRKQQQLQNRLRQALPASGSGQQQGY